MKVYLVGAGTGSADMLTERAKHIIENADVIIGSKRLTESFKCSKEAFVSCRAEEIRGFLAQKHFKSAAVLLSGDVGFYSGAKKLVKALAEYDTELVPGISSAAYLCAKLKMPWEDMCLLSLHGKNANAIGCISRYRRVFMLVSNAADIEELCRRLCRYGMGHVVLHIGQRLSYEDESIITARADELVCDGIADLSAVIAENNNASEKYLYGISDSEFIRGKVPMTKSEVRTLSLSKLRLAPDSVLYDIGSGTGSVAVEAALKCINGRVFAIEKNEEAAAVIGLNIQKFAADNITVVKGEAPEALKDLPIPTHAFIGGSGGHIVHIIKALLEKSADIRIVVNVIALNTLSRLTEAIDELGLKADIVSVSAARGESAGSYTLMKALNPVYIITLEREAL